MPLDIGFEVSNIIGKSPKILEICRLVKMVGKTNSTVLLQGESGTGKELIANAIYINSPRNKKPFIKVNCAALSETLLESELFGHKKGAFTGACESRIGRFELANGGTILLDEIGNMSLSGQAKLLRVLQENEIMPVGVSAPIEVDVRVIATTNVVLKKATQERTFREDLFYRISVVSIFLPPLRERKEDISLLVNHFIDIYNYKTKRNIRGISQETMAVLMEYDWPGNIRELRNAIEHAVIIENTEVIHTQSLPASILKGFWNRSSQDIEDFNLKKRLKAFERKLILKALIRANWVKCRAAEFLGIDQRNLSYFIRKHHILDPEERMRARET